MSTAPRVVCGFPLTITATVFMAIEVSVELYVWYTQGWKMGLALSLYAALVAQRGAYIYRKGSECRTKPTTPTS